VRAIEKYINKKGLNNSFKPLKQIFQMRTRPRISLFFVAANLISSCSYVGEINVYGNLNQGVFFKVIPRNESFLSSFKIY
jgi:hypothetical protein